MATYCFYGIVGVKTARFMKRKRGIFAIIAGVGREKDVKQSDQCYIRH